MATPGSANTSGSGNRSRWVSALRCWSASIMRTAAATQARCGGSERSTVTWRGTSPPAGAGAGAGATRVT